MKNLFFITLFACTLTAAYAQGNLHVGNLRQTGGTTPTLTFDVTWTTPPSATVGSNHRDSIWLFADFRIINADGSVGAWMPASITAATIISGNGTLIDATLPGRGFLLDGAGIAPLNATLRVTLAAPVNQRFNACIYAADWPPNAILQADNTYILNGSSPFVINSAALPYGQRSYSGNPFIWDLTDATGCPGIWDEPPCKPGRIGPGDCSPESFYPGRIVGTPFFCDATFNPGRIVGTSFFCNDSFTPGHITSTPPVITCDPSFTPGRIGS
ncbi:MAG: hypothetical protein LBS12_05350 [Prevotellaceae bacterium]|jgi:hypothetical protein|nr:hypothetical protein [Prevotellaceae bacterium]